MVDDSAFYRQTLSGFLKEDPRIEVVGAVSDGGEAIRFIGQNHPDVITLDLEMPKMDGFTFLRWLMANDPIPVVVVSSRSEANQVLKALELGAVDFVVKPSQRASLEIHKVKNELHTKVLTAAGVARNKIFQKTPESGTIRPLKAGVVSMGPAKGKVGIVAIGASTGGPPAIQGIMAKLPAEFPVPIVVAQHMPAGFTLYFAERLSKSSLFSVKEGATGDRLEPGWVYISPGGFHMTFQRTGDRVEIVLKPRSSEDRYSPSIDLMMLSAVEHYGPGVLGVVLTGMGSDGKLGMKAIKEKGGGTLAESEETSVVFGMPKEVIASGSADKILPLDQIAEELIRRVQGI